MGEKYGEGNDCLAKIAFQMGKDFYMFPSLEIGTYCNGPWLDWKMKYG